ncbi:hypothetical protein [Microtetraspora fusca]|uniref:hypothetical protein n=1 Tax=Microtetraspora fusca TaxID=1997 RepID=UPI000829E98E|nr:hypothetical protein [Microtetraspora fusca]
MRTEQESRQAARRVPARGRTAVPTAGRAQNGRDGRQVREGETADPPARGARVPAERRVPPAEPPVRRGARSATADPAKNPAGSRSATVPRSRTATSAASTTTTTTAPAAAASRSASTPKGRTGASGRPAAKNAPTAGAAAKGAAAKGTAAKSAAAKTTATRSGTTTTRQAPARPAPARQAPARPAPVREAPAAGPTTTAEPVALRRTRRPARSAAPATDAAAARSGRRPPRAPFVLLVVGLLCGGLVSLLLLNTVLAQDSFELSDLRSGTERLRQQADELDNQVRMLTQPNALDEQARGGSKLDTNQTAPPRFISSEHESGTRTGGETEGANR